MVRVRAGAGRARQYEGARAAPVLQIRRSLGTLVSRRNTPPSGSARHTLYSFAIYRFLEVHKQLYVKSVILLIKYILNFKFDDSDSNLLQ